jgi:FHA domain
MTACPSGHDSASTDFCDVCGMRMNGAAAGPVPAPPGASAPDASAPGASVPVAPAPDAGAPAGYRAPPAVAAEPCPQCGAGRTGQFCEVCGFDFASGRAPLPAAASPAPPSPAPASSAAPAGAGQDALAGPGPGTGQDVPAGAGQGAPAAPGSAAPGSAAAQAAGWTAVVTADRGYYDSVIAEGGPDASTIEFPQYCPERRFRLGGREMRIGRRSSSRGLEPEIDLTGPPTDPGVSHLHAVLIAEPDGTWAVLDPGSANGTTVNNGEIVPGVRVPLHGGDRICVGAWTVLTIQAPATT